MDLDSKSKDILLKELVRAIAVTYGKCFVSADGRRILLDKSIISSKHEKTHCNLMEMQNQCVADTEKFKICADPQGGDGIIYNATKKQASPMEHILVSQKNSESDVQTLILKQIEKKQAAGILFVIFSGFL